MARKRTATTELNERNWDEEEKPEDAGTFTVAPKEELEKRVVKTARRRLAAGAEGAPKSAFKGFSGFNVSTTPSATSTFSFLKSTTAPSITSSTQSQTKDIFSKTTTTTTSAPSASSNGVKKASKNGIKSTPPSVFSNSFQTQNEKIPEDKSKEMPKEKKENIFETSSEYFSKLKGLNESVTEWIKTHVDSNPFCLLTPIFRDYEKYLKEIETQYGQNKSSESASTSSTSTKKNIDETCSVTNTTKVAETTTKTLSFDAKPPPSFNNSGKGVFSGISSTEKNPFFKSTPASEDSTKSDAKKAESKPPFSSLSFPQSSATSPSSFRFGSSTSGTTTSPATFSFGGGKPFTFGNSVVAQNQTETESSKAENEDKEDEDEPPKVEIKPITEEGAIYEKRCKVFFKKDEGFSDRGVGVLFLKPTANGKTQLIVRAETSLGNLLLNTLLTESVPTKRANKNTVLIICLPMPDSNPPPTSVFLRVKTSEDADSLLEALESNKK